MEPCSCTCGLAHTSGTIRVQRSPPKRHPTYVVVYTFVSKLWHSSYLRVKSKTHKRVSNFTTSNSVPHSIPGVGTTPRSPDQLLVNPMILSVGGVLCLHAQCLYRRTLVPPLGLPTCSTCCRAFFPTRRLDAGDMKIWWWHMTEGKRSACSARSAVYPIHKSRIIWIPKKCGNHREEWYIQTRHWGGPSSKGCLHATLVGHSRPIFSSTLGFRLHEISTIAWTMMVKALLDSF